MNHEENSKILKALGNPLRLKMTTMLMDDECCVTDVTNALKISHVNGSLY